MNEVKLLCGKNGIRLICFLFLVIIFLPVVGRERGKARKERAPVSAYQKLFAGMNTHTAKGVLTIHYVRGKVYVEFPVRLIGKDLLFVSSIRRTSDNGEGVVGQFAENPQVFLFTREGSKVQARLRQSAPLRDEQMNKGVQAAILQSSMPGVYATFDIEAYTPDSSAVVLDMTSLFFDASEKMSPFSERAANSVWGFVKRQHKFQADRTLFKEVRADDKSVSLICEQGYDVDHMVMGNNLSRSDVKVSAEIQRMLVLLPENPMRTRYADSRIGVDFLSIPSIDKESSMLTHRYLTKRWRVEPIDMAAWRRGELVEVKKPIVFYIDTIMPRGWEPYIRAGVLEWNKAFERIGLRNVLQVKYLPNDSAFDAGNICHSVIRYSPTSPNMYRPQRSMLVDTRSGEILNASIYLHHHFLFILYRDRVLGTMASDPEARKAVLSEKVMGQMIKSTMIRVVGECLGLRSNLKASSVYPVDSLRSATFTALNGLAPSVMDEVPCNYLANEEDVKKGVLLVQDRLGEYDYHAIRWLYCPIPEAVTPEMEFDVLDKWIKEACQDVRKSYGNTLYSSAVSDPRVMVKDLGNDHLKAFAYRVNNLKIAMSHCREWFAKEDKTLELQNKLYSFMQGQYSEALNQVASYIGGMYVDEGNSDEGVTHYVAVPKATQQEALHLLLDAAKDLEWLDNQALRHDIRVHSSAVQQKRMEIFSLLFSRWPLIMVSSQKVDGGYVPAEYLEELYRMVWQKTERRQPLDPLERDFQMAFVGAVMASAAEGTQKVELDAYVKAFANGNGVVDELSLREVGAFYPRNGVAVETVSTSSEFFKMLLRIDNLLQIAAQDSNGLLKAHYEYLHYKIRQALDSDR